MTKQSTRPGHSGGRNADSNSLWAAYNPQKSPFPPPVHNRATNLLGILFDVFEDLGPKCFLRFRDSADLLWGSLSWTEAMGRAAALRQELLGWARLSPGSRVLVLSQTAPETLIAELAVLMAGATVVSLPLRADEEQARAIFSAFSPEALIVDTISTARKCKALENDADAGGKCAVICTKEGGPSDDCRVRYLADLVALSRTTSASVLADVKKETTDITKENVAYLHLDDTSKSALSFVRQTHGQIAAALDDLMLSGLAARGPDLFVALPFSQSACRLFCFAALAANRELVFGRPGLVDESSLQAVELFKDMRDVQPRSLLSQRELLWKAMKGIEQKAQGGLRGRLSAWSRASYERLIAEGRVKAPPVSVSMKLVLAEAVVDRLRSCFFGPRLRTAIVPGPPFESDLFEACSSIGIRLFEYFGAPPVMPLIAANTAGSCRPGTAGKRFASVELSRRDEDGTLLARGPGVAGIGSGGSAQLLENGWVRTGAKAIVDDEGFLRFDA